MELFISAAVCLLTLTITLVVGEPAAVSSNPSSDALVEARYDHYEDIFRYWWPWFSDLSTVVAIKLKIAIILVAMHVFGDGYYWSKWTGGSSVFGNGPFVQHPAGFGWGRRRKRSAASVRTGEEAKDTDLAELIFDKLDLNDDACRRRIVCELYLQGKRIPEVWRVMNESGYEVFRAYRPKSTVLSSAECSKLYKCSLNPTRDGLVQMRQKTTPTENNEDDWRWPR
ncbi:uncharacterized protein LOC128715295 [Anopheles marshallii]|uniref:uncharacterized protein LOC128715295 n=1 Tax=Anopheles marshallii TaxID=1521116 RepID=UPI00237B2D37|nr:uncharacterized protein LOC128715295 [Anopheles marshallii]